MLTKEAFNALLKSLEEPPLNVKFFFATTEPLKVLPTIVSRCQRFDLTRISNFEIIKKLRSIAKEIKVEIEDEALATIARLSEGSLRDAESLFDQISCSTSDLITAPYILETVGFAQRSDFFALDEAFLKNDLTFAFTFAAKLFSSGKDITYFLENLLEHYRNLMLIQLKHLQLDDAFFSKEEKEGYLAGSTIYETAHLMHILDYLSDLIHQSSRPTYKKVHLEMILLHILQTKKRVVLESLVEKLSNLEKKTEIVYPIKEEIKPSLKEEIVLPLVKDESVKEVVLEKKAPPSVRHDTVLRFAQVEFSGTLKKN